MHKKAIIMYVKISFYNSLNVNLSITLWKQIFTEFVLIITRNFIQGYIPCKPCLSKIWSENAIK